jgi:hypothetical protein
VNYAARLIEFKWLKQSSRALFQERKVKPRRADDATRWMMATLSRMFQWRDGGGDFMGHAQ